MAAVVVAGCIGGETVDPPTASPVASSAAPSISASPSASTAPPSTASPTPTPTPTPTPISSESPSASGATADVCSGTDDNREFFEGAASGLAWPVYCAVLPARWNVTSGSWTGRGGGSLDITYRGPNGATLTLHQGVGCPDGSVCQATGTDSGEAAFGDQTGTFVRFDDGGWGVFVDRFATPSWTIVGQGMDEGTFRTFAADLARLD
jgi:hypothetical protein